MEKVRNFCINEGALHDWFEFSREYYQDGANVLGIESEPHKVEAVKTGYTLVVIRNDKEALHVQKLCPLYARSTRLQMKWQAFFFSLFI